MTFKALTPRITRSPLRNFCRLLSSVWDKVIGPRWPRWVTWFLPWKSIVMSLDEAVLHNPVLLLMTEDVLAWRWNKSWFIVCTDRQSKQSMLSSYELMALVWIKGSYVHSLEMMLNITIRIWKSRNADVPRILVLEYFTVSYHPLKSKENIFVLGGVMPHSSEL
jgi:hypothetical protein